MRLILTGRIPSKKNSKIMVCRGKFPMLLPSQKYTEWHKEATLQLIKQKVPKNQINHACSISVRFYFPDKRATDLSNKFESIADLLVDYGYIKDDNHTILTSVTLVSGGVDPKNPRAEINFSDFL